MTERSVVYRLEPPRARLAGLRNCFALAVLGMAYPDRTRASFQESAMTSPGQPRRVEIKDGDRTVAAAEVTTVEHTEGTVRTSLMPPSGHAPPGSRASLVDAVMELPEVQAGSRLEATIPLGDAESLERLRERTDDSVTRPAGSTALVDGDIPSAESA
jgi:hypothetical protein